MYGNKKSVGFTPYDKSQGFSPTPANKDMGDLANSTEGNFRDSGMVVLSDLWNGRKGYLKLAWEASHQSTAKEIVEMLEKLKSKTILDDAWNEAFDTAIREINKRYNTP